MKASNNCKKFAWKYVEAVFLSLWMRWYASRVETLRVTVRAVGEYERIFFARRYWMRWSCSWLGLRSARETGFVVVTAVST